MSKNSKPGQPPEEQPDEPRIGYKSPPDVYKFKKGVSGNPKGRPKKAKSIGAIWCALAEAKCEMVVGGKKKKVARIEAVAATIMSKALKGDLKAALTAMQAYAIYGPVEQASGNADDEAVDAHILEAFLKNYLKGPESSDEA